MVIPFDFQQAAIGGVIVISPFNADDLRGSFTKDYSREIFAAHGVYHNIEEVFYTTSKRGVIRALHFQRVKHQPKLVRCLWGHVWDVVVDLRKDSPTFRKWLSFDLSSDNRREILVPAGCAHGYLVMEDSVVSYKCSEKFYSEYDDGIVWNDSTIGIDWPLEAIGGAANVILSSKDRELQTFVQFMERHGGF